MAGRTVIMATHSVESLAPLASHTVFLDDGQAIWQGTGNELLESRHMAHLKTASSSEENYCPAGQVMEKQESQDMKEMKPFEIKEATPKTPKQLIIEEKQARGSVDLKYWQELLHFNGNSLFWVAVIIVTVATCLVPVARQRTLEYVTL